MSALKPIAEGLWSDEVQPRLIAGKSRSSGALVFPFPSGAEAAQYDSVPLPRIGALWSWTIQSFRPKSPPYGGPAEFSPFAVGYVQLGDALIVEGRLTQTEGLAIGMKMEVVVIPFDQDRLTYAFAPAGAA